MTNTLAMFKSATVKLTVWYMLIIISISLLFSIIIFSIATTEISSRISSIQQTVRPSITITMPQYLEVRNEQVHEAQGNLLASLALTNLCIWIAGGVGSYYLARRTLRPIEEVHEAQSRFTSDASHELRTPLASMKVELEVALREETLDDKEVRELLQSNLEEVNKLSNLSYTLLQLSRMDHDKIIRERIDINTVTRNVITHTNLPEKRVKLHTSRQPIYVHANPSSVEELLTILLDNALKYSPPSSRIDIHVMRRKQMAGFTVTNKGKGIDTDALPHIFERFYRADQSRTSGATKGYGLGLSLAKKIVELHNGELTVSSGEDAPTTFTVLLPVSSKR